MRCMLGITSDKYIAIQERKTSVQSNTDTTYESLEVDYDVRDYWQEDIRAFFR